MGGRGFLYPSKVAVPPVPSSTDVSPEHSSARCDAALSDAFALLGKRWNGMILGSLRASPAGFSEIRRALGASDSVLADRLAELTAAGLVIREVGEGPPVVVRYRLSDSGEALVPVLEELGQWARTHL